MDSNNTDIDYSTYNADIGSINEDINVDFTSDELKKLIRKLKMVKLVVSIIFAMNFLRTVLIM